MVTEFSVTKNSDETTHTHDGVVFQSIVIRVVPSINSEKNALISFSPYSLVGPIYS
jgi:hypothetical protein